MKKASVFRRIAAAVLVITALLYGCAFPSHAQQSVTVQPIDFQNGGFIRGMDVSSVISLENSGVTFRDENGREKDLLRILADHGVNYIRVRVWNDPYDSARHGYGGGNNDVDTAALIGRRAAKYGMKLLVDFHYSDFWADPAKQKSPKSWADLSLDDRLDALSAYTSASLETIRRAGADIASPTPSRPGRPSGARTGLPRTASTTMFSPCPTILSGTAVFPI